MVRGIAHSPVRRAVHSQSRMALRAHSTVQRTLLARPLDLQQWSQSPPWYPEMVRGRRPWSFCGLLSQFQSRSNARHGPRKGWLPEGRRVNARHFIGLSGKGNSIKVDFSPRRRAPSAHLCPFHGYCPLKKIRLSCGLLLKALSASSVHLYRQYDVCIRLGYSSYSYGADRKPRLRRRYATSTNITA